MPKYTYEISFFFCRSCGEYHDKTHRHYLHPGHRNALRRKAKEIAQSEQHAQQQS